MDKEWIIDDFAIRSFRDRADEDYISWQGIAPPKFRIEGGYLEAILDNTQNPAREPLLWRNAFFGKRQRRRVRRNDWMKAENAPLYLHPELIDEILKYVHLPKELVKAYRALAGDQKKP